MKESTTKLRIGKARRGCEESIRILINEHRSIIGAVVAKYFIPGADRDDLTQEGLIGLYKAIKDYSEDAGTSFATFATLCAERQIQSAVRAANRRKHSPLNDYVPMELTPTSSTDTYNVHQRAYADSSSDPADVVVTQDNWLRIKTMVQEHASGLEAQVLYMSLGGMSYTEIASALCRQPKAVDNALQRIKRKVDAVIRAS